MLISEYHINFSWQSRSVLWKLSLIQNFIIIFLLIINQFSGYYLTYTGLLKKKYINIHTVQSTCPKNMQNVKTVNFFFLFRKIMFSIVSFTKFKKYLLKSKVIYSLLKKYEIYNQSDQLICLQLLIVFVLQNDLWPFFLCHIFIANKIFKKNEKINDTKFFVCFTNLDVCHLHFLIFSIFLLTNYHRYFVSMVQENCNICAFFLKKNI